MMFRLLKWGMVGGGRKSPIGAARRLVTRLDGNIQQADRTFSADPETSRKQAEIWCKVRPEPWQTDPQLTSSDAPAYFLSYSLSIVKYLSSAGFVKYSSWRLNQAF